jgi:cell division protein FtsQ
MSEKKRYNVKAILVNTVWIILGMGTTVLLVAAVYKKDGNCCKEIEITIRGVRNIFFIDKRDVTNMLEKMNYGALKSKPINSFSLADMEAEFEKNEWIKNAELFFDNNDVLRINIVEREPIARIFDTTGNSFYIDSSLTRLSLSDKFSARLPVFTNFPVTGKSFSKSYGNLLAAIKNLSLYIAQNEFWMAQIEQVDITPQNNFEMIPKIGNQVIVFGSADNYEEKFNNLLIFYKNVQSKVGWNKYSKLNVSYKDQVIAVKRDVQETKMDSLKTLQLMKLLVAQAQKEANDSIKNIQLVQPKDDNHIPFAQPQDEKVPVEIIPGDVNLSEKKEAVKSITQIDKPATNKNSLDREPDLAEKAGAVLIKKQTIKPIIKRPETAVTKQPKAVMKPKNDY